MFTILSFWEDSVQSDNPFLVGLQICLQFLSSIKRRFEFFCLLGCEMFELYFQTVTVSQAGVDVFLAVALYFPLSERTFGVSVEG